MKNRLDRRRVDPRDEYLDGNIDQIGPFSLTPNIVVQWARNDEGFLSHAALEATFTDSVLWGMQTSPERSLAHRLPKLPRHERLTGKTCRRVIAFPADRSGGPFFGSAFAEPAVTMRPMVSFRTCAWAWTSNQSLREKDCVGARCVALRELPPTGLSRFGDSLHLSRLAFKPRVERENRGLTPKAVTPKHFSRTTAFLET